MLRAPDQCSESCELEHYSLPACMFVCLSQTYFYYDLFRITLLYTAQNIYRNTTCFCHWSQYKCTHSPTHSKSWINEAKTCLSCAKFGYRLRMMFLDKKNEVIPFQKCPWNALCKMEFVKKITKFKDIFFNQTPQHDHFCAPNSLLM